MGLWTVRSADQHAETMEWPIVPSERTSNVAGFIAAHPARSASHIISVGLIEARLETGTLPRLLHGVPIVLVGLLAPLLARQNVSKLPAKL